MTSPELINRVAGWRAKVADGSLTMDEMKEAVLFLRAERTAASTAAAKSKSKPKATKAAKEPKKSVDDLLGDLDKML